MKTYRNADKYRNYLSLTKELSDSLGNKLGKIVVIYAHIDIDLDSLDNIILDGTLVKKGDLISKNLYSGTVDPTGSNIFTEQSAGTSF